MANNGTTPTYKTARPNRAGALCTRAACIADVTARGGTLYVKADGTVGVYHDRGNTADRAARARRIVERDGDCCWCGQPVTADTVERDRLLDGCEYRPRNLVAACKTCNRDRRDLSADEYAARCANPDHAAGRLAAVRAADPDFFAAREA